MPDWDEDSPRLRANLKKLLQEIRDRALTRGSLTLSEAKEWHVRMMRGLTPPKRQMIGQFRGSKGIAGIEVFVGSYPGVPAAEVDAETVRFETTLQQLIDHLDKTIPNHSALNPDQLSAVMETCAWAHAEWIRIHPFVNGNGRIARLWANAIAMRYRLPPFVRLRPRPNHDYEAAAREAMHGSHQPTSVAFRKMLNAFLTGKN